jgi:hypothetical protein
MLRRTCKDCPNLIATRNGKGRQKERCDECRRRRHARQARDSKRRKNPSWETRRKTANELFADKLWATELPAFFAGGPSHQADKDWMVARAGRTKFSLGNVDEEVLEEIIREPGLHPHYIQEHEQAQNNFYAQQYASSIVEVLMRGADPAQVRTPGGWTEAGTQYGNGAMFGQSSDRSPDYHAVMAASAEEAKTMAGGKVTLDAALAVV